MCVKQISNLWIHIKILSFFYSQGFLRCFSTIGTSKWCQGPTVSQMSCCTIVLGNFKSIIQRSDREPVFGSKDLGLTLDSAAYYLYGLGDKGNSIRTHKMEAAPVAWPPHRLKPESVTLKGNASLSKKPNIHRSQPSNSALAKLRQKIGTFRLRRKSLTS